MWEKIKGLSDFFLDFTKMENSTIAARSYLMHSFNSIVERKFICPLLV